MNRVADWFGAKSHTKKCPVEMGVRGIRSSSIDAEGTMNTKRLSVSRGLLKAVFLPHK